MRTLHFPKSFPTADEEEFLRLALAGDADFPERWAAWKRGHDIAEIGGALLALAPLVYLRMRALGIADEHTARLRGVHKNAWVKNQRLLAVTKSFIAACNERGIPTLVLKGVPLITEVYKDAGARFLGDADIVIPPEHGPAVARLMREGGWSYEKVWAPDASNPSPSIYRVIKETTYVNPLGIQLDLHWNLFTLDRNVPVKDLLFLRDVPSLAFRDAFWRTAVPMAVGGAATERLSNEDLLIHSVVHGADGEHQRGIRWVADAVRTIESLPLDWDAILARAKEFGFAIELSLGFRYLAERFEAPIPDAFLDALCALPVDARAVRRYYRLADREAAEPEYLRQLAALWYGYWKYEPKGAWYARPAGFVRYVSRALHPDKRRKIVSFAVKKAVERTRRAVGLEKKKPLPPHLAAKAAREASE